MRHRVPAAVRLRDARARASTAGAPLARLVVCALLGRIEVGTLELLEDGGRRSFGAGPPSATVQICSPRAWWALLRGSRGLAEAYAKGWLRSPDLVSVIRLAARNGRRIDRFRALIVPARIPLQRVRELLRPVTRRRSRRDIAAHYDLGNALFSRMLDETLSYSCAVFEREGMTLEQAQLAKLERVCAKLALGRAHRVLEIGTGWGAFAIYAARTRGCHVTTTTISREQYEYAREQVRRAGLEGRVDVLMDDYRDLRGRYDRLVSIEMIEAVGWRHIGRFLAKCSQLLEPDGAMLLQAITIDDRAYEIEKASRSFMKTFIFPGGALPSLEVLTRALARRTDMRTIGLEDITASYVQTLRCWRDRFQAHEQELEQLGYDERFRRIWWLYLCYCEAGFAERRINDIQLLIAKPAHGLGGLTAPIARELAALG